MVSVTGVTSGQAEHYYQKDNYYTKTEGQWQGKGAEALGLQGEVKKEDFQNLINGKAPDGSFEIQNGGEGQNHRAGVDLTFSAPKSVSIASEVLGDTRVREAHEKAVTEALRYVEANYSQARQTEKGITEKVDTGNLVIAKFQHDTSRELDPQLHTHAVVMNMTQREDGQWRALSNEEIFNNKMLIGQIYRNELAANLKELGYAIQSDQKGLFEIQGIDQKVLDHFSQRSEQIEQKVNELKESGLYPNANDQKLREMAALGSRVAKKDVDMNIVREAWSERMQEQGYTKEQIKDSIAKAAELTLGNEQNRTEPRLNEYDYVRMAAKIHNETESTFKREDILKTASKLSVGEYRIADLERAFTELNGDKEIKTLDAKNGIYTTAEMQRIEQSIVTKVRAGHDAKDAIMTKEHVQQGIKEFEAQRGFTMTQGQKDAVEHILTSKDRYMGIQGDAGTGKTTMLANVREQLEKAGYEVRGLGFTGKAAAEVEQQAGIKSQTVDSFLAQDKSNIPTGKEVWVVDEASMLGSSKMHDLITAAEKADARIVMIGDIKQLQAIEAGKMFSKLQEQGDLRTVRMSEVQRQKDENYKDIVKDISEKRIDRAFDKLEKQDKIHEISKREERIDAIAKDYTSRDYRNAIIVTALNKDRNELNDKIHEQLKEQGKLGQEEHTFTVRESKNLSAENKHFAQSYKEGDLIISNHAGIIGRAGTEAKVTGVDEQNHRITVQTKDGKEHTIDVKSQGQHLAVYSEKEQSFSVGEKVVFLKNDRSLNIKNGQIGEIKSIAEDGKATIKMENGQEKTINLKSQYNYIDRGYAVTDYKSQGQTSREVIYDANAKTTNYNQAYVAITRGKEDLTIYTNDKEQFKENMKQEQAKTSTLDYEKSTQSPEIQKRIEEIEIQKEALNEVRNDRYKGSGMGKIMGAIEKHTDEVFGDRAESKLTGDFSFSKADKLLDEQEQALKHGDIAKADKIADKLDKEMEKMDSREREKLDKLVEEKSEKLSDKHSEVSREVSKEVSDVSRDEKHAETEKQQPEKSETTETQKSESDKSHDTDTGKSDKSESDLSSGLSDDKSDDHDKDRDREMEM